MKTFYEFRSEADPDLHGFTDEVSGSKLPSENGPWTFIRQLASEGEWPSGISKAVTAAGVLENGFSLSNYRAAKPIIASDRVEGYGGLRSVGKPHRDHQAVDDREGERESSVRRHNVRRLPRTRGTSPRHPLGEAQLRQRARRISHRHHSRAGQGCSGLLRR